MKNIKLIYSSSISAILSVIATTTVTIWGEISPTFMNFLKSFTGHHWLTKSYLSLVVYAAGLLIFYFIPRNIRPNTARKAVLSLVAVAVAGAIVLLSFFIWQYLKA